jgi:hypothetical protein
MTQRWYTKMPSTQADTGPFSTQAILEKLGSGELGPATLVRRDGDQTWIALGDHLKFRRACPGVDPPDGRAAKIDKPAPAHASTALWMAAAVSFLVLLGFQFTSIQTPKGPSSSPEFDFAYRLGSFTGTFLLVWAIAWLPSLWKANRTQRNRVVLFFSATLVLLAINVSSRLAISGTRAYVKAGALESPR